MYRGDIPISTLHLKASEDLAPGEVTVTAAITYQACNETACFPPAEMVKALKLQVNGKEKKRQEVYGWGSW